MCGGGLRSGGLRGGGLRGGDLRGGSLRSDENLRSFRQAKILITARCATFFVPRLRACPPAHPRLAPESDKPEVGRAPLPPGRGVGRLGRPAPI